MRESVGGSPILVRDGKRWFTDPGDDFTDARHPRTLVGWTAGGDELLVTVDGRQPGLSVGMSLFEATDFLIALGATDGINLDGGGSTTFVQGGNVVNHVSDVQVRNHGQTLIRHSVQKGDTLIGPVERPVASALVVVPSIAVSVPPVDPLAGVALGLHEQAPAPPRRGSRCRRPRGRARARRPSVCWPPTLPRFLMVPRRPTGGSRPWSAPGPRSALRWSGSPSSSTCWRWWRWRRRR